LECLRIIHPGKMPKMRRRQMSAQERTRKKRKPMTLLTSWYIETISIKWRRMPNVAMAIRVPPAIKSSSNDDVGRDDDAKGRGEGGGGEDEEGEDE
jgi:hypothetical protein